MKHNYTSGDQSTASHEVTRLREHVAEWLEAPRVVTREHCSGPEWAGSQVSGEGDR